PLSVTTGRTLERIAADRDRVWNSNRGERGEVLGEPGETRGESGAGRGRSTPAARVARTKAAEPAAPGAGGAARPPAARRGLAAPAAAVPGARKASLPTKIAAQLATLVDDPPKGDAWLHEMKFDGYRILARLQAGRARLLSRNGKDWTDHFPTVARAVEEL